MQLRLVRIRDDADKTEDKAEVYEVESDDDQPVPPSKARRVQAASTSSTSPPGRVPPWRAHPPPPQVSPHIGDEEAVLTSHNMPNGLRTILPSGCIRRDNDSIIIIMT